MIKKKKAPKHAGLVPLMTADQVKDHLGISLRTLYRIVNSGKLTAYKLDGMLRINPADSSIFLSMRALRAGTPAPFEELTITLPTLDGSRYRTMTDAEAQQFFAGVKRDEAGNIWSNPDLE
jgi:excisionase family DNA binding protein